MYPPKVGDHQVRTVIRSLAAAGKVPSGVAVREELARRYGSRGGVTRIYRLLAAEQLGGAVARSTATATAIGPGSGIEANLLRIEIQNLKGQLQQAQQRERAHEDYWTRQFRSLCALLEQLEVSAAKSAAVGSLGEPILTDIRATRVRAGQMETLVRTFGPTYVTKSAADDRATVGPDDP